MKTSSHIFSWILQLGIVALLAPAAYSKLTNHPDSIALFTSLDMESAGRYVIGFLEAITCLLLLIPQGIIHGAMLSLCVMLGALIAHATKLGFTDMFSFSPIILIIMAALIILLRRSQIRSIARMLH